MATGRMNGRREDAPAAQRHARDAEGLTVALDRRTARKRALLAAWLLIGVVEVAFVSARIASRPITSSSEPAVARLEIARLLLAVDGLLLLAFGGSAACVLLLWRRRIALRGGRLVLDSPFGSFDLALTDVASLVRFRAVGTFAAAGAMGEYYVHARDGRISWFVVLENAHPELEAFLREVEARTGHRWETGEKPAKAGFREFLPAFRAAAGLRGRKDNVVWILAHSFALYPGEAGLHGPVFRWALVPYQLALLCLLSLLLPRLSESWTFRFVVCVLTWASVCLGTSVLLVVTNTQRRQREALERELAVARQVQQRLFPAAPPARPDLAVAGVCLPAESVGGDYFDFIVAPDGSLTALVADVSGKGLGAGLLMTLTKGCLAASLAHGVPLGDVLSAANQVIRASSSDRMFVTMALARVLKGGSKVEVVRAGHCPPLFLPANGDPPRWLAPAGIALGLDRGTVFDRTLASEVLSLSPGDVLVLYTDGVTEAMDLDAAQYGEERLRDAVVAHRTGRPEEIKQAVLDDLAAFRRGAAPSDDVTLVVLAASLRS